MRKAITLLLSLLLMGVNTVFIYAADVESKSEQGDENVIVENNLLTQEVLYNEPIYTRSFVASEPASIGTEASLLDSRALIGPDDRYKITSTTTFPYSAIVHLLMTFPNGREYVGSGSIVDRNRVITAGHNLYNARYGGHVTSIKVTPGKNGASEPFGWAYAVRTATVKGYVEYNNTDYDYGVIILNSNIGDKTGELGLIGSNQTMLNKMVNVTGYPSEKGYTMWKDIGRISKDNGIVLSYMLDTTGGQSGSPVYFLDSVNGYSAIGIHVRGYENDRNEATKITLNNFEFLANYE